MPAAPQANCAVPWCDRLGKAAEAMREAGIVYVPMVYSCYGRAHGESVAVLEHIASAVGRRMGVADTRPVLRRAQAAVGVALQRRAVAMVMAAAAAFVAMRWRAARNAATMSDLGQIWASATEFMLEVTTQCHWRTTTPLTSMP